MNHPTSGLGRRMLAALLLLALPPGCLGSEQPLFTASDGTLDVQDGTYRTLNKASRYEELSPAQQRRCVQFMDNPDRTDAWCDVDAEFAPTASVRIRAESSGDVELWQDTPDGTRRTGTGRTLTLGGGFHLLQYEPAPDPAKPAEKLYIFMILRNQGRVVQVFTPDCRLLVPAFPNLVPDKDGACLLGRAADVLRLARHYVDKRRWAEEGPTQMYHLASAG